MQLYTWLVGSLAALSAYLPQSIQGLVIASGILTITDTITGYAISKRRQNARSFTIRQKLASKSQQFLTILAMGAAAAVIARAWIPIGLSLSAIIAIEFVSNLENLIWLEHNGGAPLGPARPMLLKVAQVLGIGLDADDIGSIERGRLLDSTDHTRHSEEETK